MLADKCPAVAEPDTRLPVWEAAASGPFLYFPHASGVCFNHMIVTKLRIWS